MEDNLQKLEESPNSYLIIKIINHMLQLYVYC